MYEEDGTPVTAIPPRKPQDAPRIELCYQFFGIAALSIAGVACRMALLASVSENEFFPSSTVVTVNTVGCLVMGMLYGMLELKAVLPYTYVGLTVGFCGSFTTFSSWMNAVMNDQDPLVQCITGLTIPFTFFLFGEDLVSGMDFSETFRSTPEIALLVDKACVAIFSLAAVLTLVTVSAVGDTAAISNGDLISCALGPIGALTRYALSSYLNGRWELKNFMLGTFASNTIAVVIDGALTHCSNKDNWCEYSIVGICGSLSTVSSWVLDTAKIYRTSKPWGYFYCLISVGVGLAIMIPFKQ